MAALSKGKTIKFVKVHDSQGKVVVESCGLTQNAWERMVGLLNRSELGGGEGLLIEGSNSIHTFFMRFSIDVVFLDRRNQVVGIVENLAPWRITKIYWSARSVLELPAGANKALGLKLGERISWSTT